MIIPAVFSFSGGNPENLQAGPSLMFITLPKVFASMGIGTAAGIHIFICIRTVGVKDSHSNGKRIKHLTHCSNNCHKRKILHVRN